MGKTVKPVQVSYGSFKAYKYEYEWTPTYFKSLTTGSKEESEYINCKLEDETKSFHLRIYPCGYNKRVENYVSIFLKKYDESDEMLIQFTCAILNNENKEINVKSIKQKMSVESYIGWISYCRRDYILDDDTILSNGNLTLKCTIEIFDNKAIMNAETEDDTHLLLLKMSCDLNKLLFEEDFTDVVFKVEDQTLPAHKAILSARSAVFKTMMKYELKGDSKVIDILDIKCDIVKKMLLFIYSGDIGDTDHRTAMELYYAADKYELNDLISVCSKILACNLDINNAIDTLLLGYSHTNRDIQCAAIEYISKNLSEIQDKQEWLSLLQTHPMLANSVLKYRLKNSFT